MPLVRAFADSLPNLEYFLEYFRARPSLAPRICRTCVKRVHESVHESSTVQHLREGGLSEGRGRCSERGDYAQAPALHSATIQKTHYVHSVLRASVNQCVRAQTHGVDNQTQTHTVPLAPPHRRRIRCLPSRVCRPPICLLARGQGTAWSHELRRICARCLPWFRLAAATHR